MSIDLLLHAVKNGEADFDELIGESEQQWQYWSDDHHLVRFDADADPIRDASASAGSAGPTAPGTSGTAPPTRSPSPAGTTSAFHRGRTSSLDVLRGHHTDSEDIWMGAGGNP